MDLFGKAMSLRFNMSSRLVITFHPKSKCLLISWPYGQQPTRLLCPQDSLGKNTGMGCHFLLQCMKVKVKSLIHVQLLATPWTAAYQPPSSMGFFKQEYWSGLPLPSLNCQCRWNKISPTKVSSKWIVDLNGKVRKPGRRYRGISL